MPISENARPKQRVPINNINMGMSAALYVPSRENGTAHINNSAVKIIVNIVMESGVNKRINIPAGIVINKNRFKVRPCILPCILPCISGVLFIGISFLDSIDIPGFLAFLFL
jgi:hypothetical protein